MKLKDKSKSEQRDQLRAGLILRMPTLFDETRKNIDQIYALINTYITRKDYQVIKSGLNALCFITFKYIGVRNGTFFPSSLIQDYDFSGDSFLNDVFEKLAALHRIASRDKDLELSKEIIECFAKIAVKCTSITYRAAGGLSEYTHCMLAGAYMEKSIEDSLTADLLDIGIHGTQNLQKIGLVLIARNAHIDLRIILDNLSKIAMYGIAKPNASFLLSYPLQAYSIFLRAALFNKKVYDELLPKTILEKVQVIADFYVKLKEPLTSPFSVDLQYSLGDFIDLTKSIAMPNIFAEAYNKIIDEKTEQEDKKQLINKLLEFGHELWHFYDSLSKSAAEKESFLIHFIDSNIEYIATVLLKLYESYELNEKQKEKSLDDVRWIISNYWRIYTYHKTISKNYQMQILENLLKLGHEFNRLSLEKELDSVISIIVSIAQSFLEKQKDSYGYEPSRIIMKATYLCILNGSDNIKNKFLTRIKDKFWENYIAKYPQHKELLFKELSEIDPDQLRFNGHHLSFEDNILSRLKKEQIDNFILFLKGNLKNEG